MRPKALRKSPAGWGFTLLELAILVFVIAWCGLLAGTALARSPNGVRTFLCLNNTRQLVAAWQMYSEDNGGRLVSNLHGAGLTGGGESVTWARGWMDFTTSTDNTNILFLVDRRYARLAPYVNKAANIFRCPEDNYVSGAQRARGITQRVRSYSANIGVGAGNAEQGPWAAIYKHFTNNFEFFYPGPAETWVFTEEHPDSINDTAFFNPYPNFVDFPAVYHDAATVLAFADGHSELHRWTGALRTLPVKMPTGFLPTINRPNDPDTHWMSWHGGRTSTNSY
jgi:hypothetical protein